MLLVEETGVPGENHLSNVTDKLFHVMLCRVHLVMSWIRTHNISGYMGLLKEALIPKEIIRSGKAMNRQFNGQTEMDKKTNDGQRNTTRKTKEQYRIH